ncbi:hypothetical protein [Tomitella biformata]|uniref:hypothetical protein n=1 Tax=Tomitella biformata TaxID=630403 RepID=UPI0004630A40|nr:hypothetical protein [Tomitella biformata]
MPIASVFRGAVVAVAVSAAALVGAAGPASADVAPGAYTSTTSSSGVVLLQRDGQVQGQDLVLIGRYPIHPTPTGGYVDFFPGHRVFMNSDGQGGYDGPAYLGGLLVGTFTLTPHR